MSKTKERLSGVLDVYGLMNERDCLKKTQARVEPKKRERHPCLYVLSEEEVLFRVNREDVREEIYLAILLNCEEGIPITFTPTDWEDKKYAQNIELL